MENTSILETIFNIVLIVALLGVWFALNRAGLTPGG